jgi:hypothetical protein
MYFNAFHMVSYYDKIYAISEVIQMVNKRLGDVVKQERLKLNLSQNALAEQAKVSLRTVSDIETYNGNPRLDTLYALANYLHISIDAVFSDKKSNMDSTMQQIIAELNSRPEEQKQLALSTLRGLLDGFKNLS